MFHLIPILVFHLGSLSISSADILSDHLSNNVNASINPCDDFFLHVCSQSINSTAFPFAKIANFYEQIAGKYRNFSRSRNLSIMNDIVKLNNATNENKPEFNRSEFEYLVRTRCKKNNECYREEFGYFYQFFIAKTNTSTDRLNYFKSKLNKTSSEEIIRVLVPLVESVYDHVNFTTPSRKDIFNRHFYGALTNRLFVMEQLKQDGIFDRIVIIDADLKHFKRIIIEKFRKTPWLNEADHLGLTFLAEFEEKIRDMMVYYDLDENDRDLELLREINSKFTQAYYKAKLRSTGNNILDIHLSLDVAFQYVLWAKNEEVINETYTKIYEKIKTKLREIMLVLRVEFQLSENAFYSGLLNRVAILAPYLFPELTDNTTLNKHYNLFSTIGHEIFHSVIFKEWATKSDAYKNGMECLNDHFNRTCDLFGEGSCNSGAQTFTEDGPDIEGLRIDYEFLAQNYNEHELKDVVFKSDSLSVNREQAFFYLHGITFCQTITKIVNHTDVHSPSQVRVNGVVTQMPEFSRAFACTPDQLMYAHKNKVCHLFGPESK